MLYAKFEREIWREKKGLNCHLADSKKCIRLHTVDLIFGPFTITANKKELKRYGVIFTCLSSRTIHLEIANSLESNCFLLALRRFIGRRWKIQQMYPSNDSNFIGAISKLRKPATTLIINASSIIYRLLD